MDRYYSTFEELTKAATQHLEDLGRGKQTISIYNWIWRRIKSFMDSRGLKRVDSETVAAYLIEAYGEKEVSALTHHEKHCYRCAVSLAQFSETGKMIERTFRGEKVVLSGEFGRIIEQYVAHKRSLRLNEKTLRGHSWYLYRFQTYLHENGIDSPESLSPLVIVNYVSKLLPDAAGARHLALSIIRNFLAYLYGLGRIKKDLSYVIPRDNYKKQAKLPSVYTREEISALLESIDRSCPAGKRNYAIIMLAVRLGLRASDISGLEFRHLLWSQNTITFQQHKTKETLKLPLTADVGEALIDYIKYARPTSDETFVFLENKYPHRQIHSKMISGIADRVIKGSGIKIGARKHGSHALRHTMASMLLENQVSLPVISNILGHSSIQTSMCYLRIDIEVLRQCALEAPDVPESFYTQKGGILYA